MVRLRDRAGSEDYIDVLGAVFPPLALQEVDASEEAEHTLIPALSLEGQFLAKDSVLLGASILTAAESLRAASR